MNIKNAARSKISVALMVGALFVSGCSSSGDPSSADNNQTNGQGQPANDNNANTPSGTDGSTTGNGGTDLSSAQSTRVDFNITVPEYVSNALQVRLVWGDKDITGSWVADESWLVSGDFPANTENQLTVTFSDNNGGITLSSFETTFKTGSAASQSFTITASQFNSTLWDDDADGVANLDELIAGSDPLDAGAIQAPSGQLLPVAASVELLADKTFRIRWELNTAADYYRVLENPDGVSGYTAITEELDASTDYYDHRVALHKRVNARYMVEACNASGCTLSVQQLIEGSLVDAIGYFKASNADQYDEFGTSVSLSSDGMTLAVSASNESNNAAELTDSDYEKLWDGAGAVYVYARKDGKWTQQAYLKASNADATDRFGSDISLSADGNTLSVGAPLEDSAATGINSNQSDNTVMNSGAVYVFVRSGENWQQEAYIKADNTAYDSQFGGQITLSSDGNTLAVGATREETRAPGSTGNQYAQIRSGAAYVFERSNGVWQQQAFIKSLRDSYGYLGRSISLSGDGDTLAIGIYDNASTSGGLYIKRGADFDTFYGAVYVLARSNETWQEQAYLLPSSGGSRDRFGDAISLSADGNTLATSSGASVDVYGRVGDDWQEQALVKPSNRGGGFGNSISLSADGSTLAVGAPYEKSAAVGLQGYQGFEISKDESGAVYVFSNADGSWQQQAYAKASNSDKYFHFGGAVSLSANGDTLAVGSVNESNPKSGINVDQSGAALDHQVPGYKAGAVYLY